MAPYGSLSQRTSPLAAGFGVCSPPGTGAPAAPGSTETPACIPAIRSPRGPPLRAIIVSAASTMPGFTSVESCTSAGPCGAGGWLHAASSAAATATLRSNFMGAQSGPPGALVNGEQPSVAGKRLDRRIAELLEAAPAFRADIAQSVEQRFRKARDFSAGPRSSGLDEPGPSRTVPSLAIVPAAIEPDASAPNLAVTLDMLIEADMEALTWARFARCGSTP